MGYSFIINFSPTCTCSLHLANKNKEPWVTLEITSEIPLTLSLEETPYSAYYGNRATQPALRIRAFKNDTPVDVRTHITFFSVAEAELHDAKV